jgi:large subunit ribosomal protein L29
MQDKSMKAKELSTLSVAELQDKLSQVKAEYNNLKLQSKVSSIENPIQLRILRRNIARIATVLTQNSSK